MTEKKYQRLELEINLPEYIENDIQDMLDYLNAGKNPLLADVYESTINNDINSSVGLDFDEDIACQLRNYYVLGGIYND